MCKVKSKSANNARPEIAVELKHPPVTQENRYRMIAEAAYFRAVKRGFVHGDMMEDWLQAEAEIDGLRQEVNCEKTKMNIEEIERQVSTAVENNTTSIADKVRTIAIQALSEHEFDIDAIKRVIVVVVSGAQRGAANRAEHGVQAMNEAMRGLDDALAAAAEAMQLAIQEAAGRTEAFSRQGLRKVVNDLDALESMFIDTLADAARSAAGFAKDTLRDLADHARASGTTVGDQIESVLSLRSRAVADMAREKAEIGAQGLRKETALLASLAAGMLNSIAERLQSTPGSKPKHPTAPKGS